jgi:chorismate mutase
MVTIRGATSIEKDHKKVMEKSVVELMDKILKSNKIEHVEAVIFSVTPDIKSANPSTIVRRHYNWNDVSFMTVQEAVFEGSEKGIIRVMVFCESSTKNFVYLGRTIALRK